MGAAATTPVVRSANCNKAASARAVLGPAFGGRNHTTRMVGFQRTDESKVSDSAKVDVRIPDDLEELTEPELHDPIATHAVSAVAAGEVERRMDELERATEPSKDPSDVFVTSRGKVTHLDVDNLSLLFPLLLPSGWATCAPPRPCELCNTSRLHPLVAELGARGGPALLRAPTLQRLVPPT